MKSCDVKVLFTLCLVVVLVGCATGPVEDIEDPSVPSGPGLFTGTTGDFSVTEAFKDQKRRKVGGATAYDVDLPAMDQQSFEEYERFKAWRRAQTPDSTEYKEFLEWQEYRRYKQEQAQ